MTPDRRDCNLCSLSGFLGKDRRTSPCSHEQKAFPKRGKVAAKPTDEDVARKSNIHQDSLIRLANGKPLALGTPDLRSKAGLACEPVPFKEKAQRINSQCSHKTPNAWKFLKSAGEGHICLQII